MNTEVHTESVLNKDKHFGPLAWFGQNAALLLRSGAFRARNDEHQLAYKRFGQASWCPASTLANTYQPAGSSAVRAAVTEEFQRSGWAAKNGQKPVAGPKYTYFSATFNNEDKAQKPYSIWIKD
ncbi:hypothetical protein [Hymenobacter cellulosilyticus]|uniref:Uncharacterized protein n=1 Tax=Hymenobacter cellulosilyticus TaxID=2932248 RepID=A0A8T9Q408_9BACT|nr:hypothetical protein [Hymenobacter cellulosilyticus]UOQ72304.1 hypothetical protein MUN79_27800 [Hymenobacter cellulosilyticus]